MIRGRGKLDALDRSEDTIQALFVADGLGISWADLGHRRRSTPSGVTATGR
jgi:hypothetical protein